jgi:hypothetical protein
MGDARGAENEAEAEPEQRVVAAVDQPVDQELGDEVQTGPLRPAAT